MRVLVVTVVHTPLDARIHNRQIRALCDAGIEVTYAAPWSATQTPVDTALQGVHTVDLPRAVGRRRLAALRRARRCIRARGPRHDVVLLHDPELLLAVVGRIRQLPPIVLDVHEDTATSLVDRPWLPSVVRPLAAWVVRRLERWAERRVHLLLAEEAYQRRFTLPHPFVPNVPPRPTDEPPPSGDDRVVYLGRIARSRGALEMLAAAEALRDELRFELIGPADTDVQHHVEEAAAAGHVTWTGFVPNDEALRRLDGALAGLSLIEPQPNHAVSLQTKVLEYLSRRIPVVTSDLPVTGAFVREHDVGIVVPHGDVPAVVAALRSLRDDETDRRAKADRGFALIRNELNWEVAGPRFVEHLRGLSVDP